MKKTILEILLGIILIALAVFIVYRVYPNKIVLYVSNQSTEVDPVGIKIQFDGVTIADKEFVYGNGNVYEKFEHSLSRGSHKFYAESTSGGAQLHQEFTISGKSWGVVEYRREPGRTADGAPTPGSFSFRVENKPISF